MPDREAVEFAVLPVRDAGAMLPVLKRDFERQPHRVFSELALDRRLIEAPDSKPFHDVAREMRASQWFIHQDGRWIAGQVLPRSRQSLLHRWHDTARESGGGRFQPGVGLLGHNLSGGGGRSNCIMGAATELFLDDYPSSLSRVVVENPFGGSTVHYVDFSRRAEPVTMALPRIVQRELGLSTDSGQFALNPAAAHTLEYHTGQPISLLLSEMRMRSMSLVSINDHLRNWPLLADLIALPAPDLFTRS